MLSIRNVLITVFLLISIALSAIVSKSLHNSYVDYGTFREVADRTAVDKALFDILLNFRLERGHSSTVLSTSADKAKSTSAMLPDDRSKVDAAMTDLSAAAASVDDLQLAPLLTKIKSAYESTLAQRKDVDRQLALPLEARDKSVRETLMSSGANFLTDLEAASKVTEAGIRTLDNSLMDLVQIRVNAWTTRASVGAAAIVLNKATSSGDVLPQADILDMTTSLGRAVYAWKQVGTLIDHPKTDASLKASFANAESTFFGGSFDEMHKSIIKNVSSGGVAGVSLEDWQAGSTKGQATIADVALTAMTVLNDTANNLASAALHGVIAYSALLIGTFIIGTAGLLIVVRRVVRPIGALTHSMQTLAHGDAALTIPFLYRRDEVGKMAVSLETFRLAALRNRQLEAGAEESRIAAERDRIAGDRFACNRTEASCGR
jgi:methyl-accepting chemotaxis protein